MSKTKFGLKQLCACAVMTALFAVLDAFSFRLGNNMKLTLGGLPVIIAAVFFGPLAGAAVGLLGSFIGQLLSYGLTATTVLWILPAGIRGLSMGLIFIALGRSIGFPKICASVFASSLLVTAANTLALYADSKLLGYYSFAIVFGVTGYRILASLITAAVYSVLLIPILKAMKKII